MSFKRTSSATPAQSNSADNTNRNKAAGYLNISVVTRDGTKRLGNSGIPLREGHPLEAAILALCRENPERAQELAGRLQISFAPVLEEGTVYDLGID